MSSYEFRMWGIRKRDRQKPYQVRWLVAGRSHAETFVTRALAESFRAELMSAARAGEAFDEVTGLPESRARDVPWFDHAMSYVDTKWPRAAAKSRKSIAEALTTVTMALLLPRRGRPDDALIRRALFGWAFNTGRPTTGKPSAEIAEALAWVAGASRPVSSLRDLAVIRSVLDALTVRLDGKPAAATSVYRKRAVFYNALGLAVERRLLLNNPVDQVQWTAPDVAEAVDRRVVASPAQVRALLDAVRASHAAASTWWPSSGACTTRACVRPRSWPCGRVTASYRHPGGDGCSLPGQNPGPVRNGPTTARLANAARSSVAPPTRSGLCRSPPSWSACSAPTWRPSGPGRPERCSATNAAARSTKRAPDGLGQGTDRSSRRGAGPLALARRPYDLRHAAASLWLNNGVPATEVARRLGHDVAVLLKIYANCIEGQEGQINDRITAALTAHHDHETLPPAPAVDTAAQPNPRTRRGPEPAR